MAAGVTLALAAAGGATATTAAEIWTDPAMESALRGLPAGQPVIPAADWTAFQNEADPQDREGKLYYLHAPDGSYKRVGLKEFRHAQAWDAVTFHQYSGDSRNLKTYGPCAQFLSEYVRRNAPQAKGRRTEFSRPIPACRWQLMVS
jgi:hypothetical protein